MKHKKFLIQLIIFIGSTSSYANCFQNSSEQYLEIERSFIIDPNQSHHQIEFFTLKPQGTGPFPVIFLLHGYQTLENKSGGEQLIQLGYLDNFIKEGIAAVSISIPGFGHSEGIRDFCGPLSQKAIAAVVDYVAKLPFIDCKRMGIYGISRGATLASTVHKYTPFLSLQILEGGWYDLVTCSSLMPAYLEKIKENIHNEAGNTKEDLIERSAVYNTEYIRCKTLILLGEFDDRRTRPSSIALHEKLITEGKDSQIKIYPNELHTLSADKWSTIISFVRECFFHLHGIGINVSLVMPAIQIAKIHQNSPADLSGKLHVGDIILRISPNNDEKEIDVLRMPIHQFKQLILGKRGTNVRLHIQHFDQSCEDIVIQRT